MEYSSTSTYSQKMLHSIYYSSVPPLPIPKHYQKEWSLSHISVTIQQDFGRIVPPKIQRRRQSRELRKKYVFLCSMIQTMSTTAEDVVIEWGQNNSLGSGGAVSPPAGPGQSPVGVQGEKPPEAQRFSQIQPD